MMPDPQNKNPRTFQCRDYLWDAFESIAHEMDCTPDSLVNEAMRVYLQSKGRGGPMADIPEPLEPRAGGGFRPPNQAMGQQGMQQGMGQQGMGGMQRPGMPGAPPPMGNQQRPGMPGAPPPMPGMPPSMQAQGQQGQRPPMPSLNQGAQQQGMQSQQGMQQGGPRLPPLGGQQGGGLPPMNPNAQRPQGGPGALPSPGGMMGQPRVPTQMPGAPSQMGAPMQQPMGQQGGMGAQRPMAPPPQQQQQQHMPPPQQPMAPPQRPPQQQGRQGGTLVAIYEGQQYPVTKEEFVIGRGQKTSDLTIRDSNVSRRHACVVLYNGQYWIVDQQSTNGVEFNGVKVDKKVVEHGDLYRICDHEIQFVYR